MLNRLLGIIYILMNKGKVRALDLAQRFEVSVRTIYRDVETLAIAGIPVYAEKGRTGGIRLTEQFVLNKLLINREEQLQILAALASLEETGAQETTVLEKLGEFFQTEPEHWVAIDFSDWSDRRKELFEQLKQAVLSHHLIEFDYYGQYGEMSRRCVEPIQLLFKEYTWYLRAYCKTRQAVRLFKVFRMKRVLVTKQEFIPEKEKYQESLQTVWNQESVPADKMVQEIKDLKEVVLKLNASEAYRVYDRFEEEEITVIENGDFLIRMKTALDDWVYGLILSFGPAAKVLEPKEVQKELKQRLKKMSQQYDSEEICCQDEGKDKKI